MKKKLILLLVSLLVVMSFAGCGKKEEAETSDSGASIEKTESTDVEVEELSKKDENMLERLMEKEAKLDSYSYKTSMDLGVGSVTEMTMYKSKDWMRMESQVDGLPKTVTLFNMAEGKVYSINEAQKQIILIEDPEMFMDPAAGIDMVLENGMVPEGTELEKVDYKGKKALLLSVEIKDPETGQEMGTKIWYDEDKGVPLAYEMAFGAETILTEFEYDFSKVSDHMFELPEGYDIVDMGNLDTMFENLEMDLEGMDMGDVSLENIN